MTALSSRSWRSVAPCSEMPANTPRDRDQDRISARIRASVCAEAWRPTGPAATSPSPPSVKLLSSKFTRGGEGEVAAGPVGRQASAQTDALMRAEILSWSRSRGVFAGISLQGATLRQDLDDSAVIYGKRMANKEIVESGI